MNTITCPKCNTENPASAMNCTQCRINLQFALEHSEEVERIRKATADREKEIELERPSVSLHKRFFRLSIVLALPFISCGSCWWMWGASMDNADLGTRVRYQSSAYLYGDLVYKLGKPLTSIVLDIGYARGLSSSDHWWAIPLIDLLFVLQWVIWGQLLALGIRWLRSLGRGGE